MADNIEKKIQEAETLAGQGQVRDALSILHGILEDEPGNSGARKSLIDIHLRRQDFTNAVQEYLDWAASLKKMRDYEGAVSVYRDLLNLESSVEKKSFLVGGRAAEGTIQIRDLINAVRPQIYADVGRLYYELGDLGQSIQYLAAAVESDPSDVGARLALGRAYMKKDMDREAIGEFQEVVRLAPDGAAYAYEMLGDIFMRSGKPPQSTMVWFRNAGDLYIRNKRYDDAVRVFQRVLKIEPRNKDVLMRIGEIYAQMKDYSRASQLYKQLAVLYSDEGLLDKVIMLYEKMVEWNPDDINLRDRIIEMYRKVLGADPSNLSARHKLIGHLFRKDSIDEAMKEFLVLAKAYVDKGLLEDGIKVCTRLLELDGENIGARELLGQIYLKEKNTDRALEEYLKVTDILRERGETDVADAYAKKLLNIFPQKDEILIHIARSSLDQKNWNEALLSLDRVLRGRPRNLQAMKMKINILDNMGRFDEAISVSQNYLKLEPDSLDVREKLLDFILAQGKIEPAREQAVQLSKLFEQKGESDSALRIYGRVLDYLPEDREIRKHIGDLYFQKGDKESAKDEYLLLAGLYYSDQKWDESLDLWNRVLEIWPENLSIRRRLSDVKYRQGDKEAALQILVNLMERYQERRLERPAVNVLEEALELSPGNIELRRKLIDLLMKHLRFDEASVHFKTLLKNYLNADDPRSAAVVARELIALHPFDLEMRQELAETFTTYRSLSEAQWILEDMADLYRSQGDMQRASEVYGRVADLYRRQGDTGGYWKTREKVINMLLEEKAEDAALAGAREVIVGELEENLREMAMTLSEKIENMFITAGGFKRAYNFLEETAKTLSRRGESEGEIYILERIERLYEKENRWDEAAELLEKLAVRYEASDNFRDSLRLYEQRLNMAVDRREEEAYRHYFPLFRLRLKLGEKSEAMDLYERAQGRYPDVIELARGMGDQLFENGQMEDAIELYKEVHNEKPESAHVTARLATLLALDRQFVSAVEKLKSILGSGMTNRFIDEYKETAARMGQKDDISLNLGTMYQALGFAEDALGEYEKAARIKKHALVAYNLAGLVLKEEGMLDKAAEIFIRGLELHGYSEEDYLDLRYNLGLIYEAQERFKEALAAYQECYAIDIRFRDVADRIKKIGERGL
ncbi:MAG: tetratricopeptide repeat protein [Chloroflexi bacterium]|nr:tetratricopeptide repeat protein [Chloroflexota bacterium]